MTALAIRRWHTYLGLLIAPSVIFFALTGAAQLFNFHEAHGSYHPPALMEKLSAVHKDRVYEQPRAREPHSGGPGDDSEAKKDTADEQQSQDHPGTLVLKWFFLLVALGLCVSSCLGVYLGLTQSRRKSLCWLQVAAGCLIPVGILAMS